MRTPHFTNQPRLTWVRAICRTTGIRIAIIRRPAITSMTMKRVIWNPPIVGAFMVLVYAPLTNGWCILSQRYNRIRLQRVLIGRHSASPG